MINMTQNFHPFSIKLADRVDKNGKIIPGKEKSFDSAFKMWEFYNLNKKPTKKKKKKVDDEENEKKKGRTLHRKKLSDEMTNTQIKKLKGLKKEKFEQSKTTSKVSPKKK